MNMQEAAEQKFGVERASELRPEIEGLVADLEKLRTAKLDIDDEP